MYVLKCSFARSFVKHRLNVILLDFKMVCETFVRASYQLHGNQVNTFDKGEGENEANQEISATSEYILEHPGLVDVSDEVRYGPHDWEKRIDYEYHGTKDNGIDILL